MVNKKQIAELLNNIADKMEFIKENPYKISAFRKGAEAIRRTNQDIENAIKQKKLSTISGIGKSLEAVIEEYCTEGESSLLNELENEVPAGIEKLLKIKGLGPKKILKLHTQLGISNLSDLEEACKSGSLSVMKEFGEAEQPRILKEIELLRKNKNYVLVRTADFIRHHFEQQLDTLKCIMKYELTDQMRRGAEIVSSIQYVILVTSFLELRNAVEKLYSVTISDNSIIISEHYQVEVAMHIALNEEDYHKLLFITTGSEAFLELLLKGQLRLSGKNEKEIFKSLRAPYVIPEMREQQYFEAEKKLRSNSDLTVKSLKGLLHFHSTYSDGTASLDRMVRGAKELGFTFAAVCDHSKFAHYANGLTEDRILLQTKELKELSLKYKLQLFQGIECDILKDGSLDYEPNFLKSFDFVVASVHKRFSLSEKEMTARMIKAIENPNTDLLGHPSGRFLLSRAPYEFNVKKIIDACSAHNVAIEINSNPKRLDIDWRWIYYAREKECWFSINADAHSIQEIDYLEYGIKMGRKGGLQTSEVINCMSNNDFISFLKRKIKRKLKIPGPK